MKRLQLFDFAFVCLILAGLILGRAATSTKLEKESRLEGYQGIMGAKFQGIYNAEESEKFGWIFYLVMPNNSLIQLVFYCGAAQTRVMYTAVVKQYASYCDLPNQIPLSNGESVSVEGTLIVPTMLTTFNFIGDLYVFHYCNPGGCYNG